MRSLASSMEAKTPAAVPANMAAPTTPKSRFSTRSIDRSKTSAGSDTKRRNGRRRRRGAGALRTRPTSSPAPQSAGAPNRRRPRGQSARVHLRPSRRRGRQRRRAPRCPRAAPVHPANVAGKSARTCRSAACRKRRYFVGAAAQKRGEPGDRSSARLGRAGMQRDPFTIRKCNHARCGRCPPGNDADDLARSARLASIALPDCAYAKHARPQPSMVAVAMGRPAPGKPKRIRPAEAAGPSNGGSRSAAPGTRAISSSI